MVPRRLIVIFLFSPLIGVGLYTLTRNESTLAVEAASVDLDGQSIWPLAVENSGVTILFFLTPDCPISNRYIPTIRELGKEFAAQGAHVWLVYPDSDVTSAAVRAHLRDYDLHIPAVRDPSRDLVNAARATTLPETAVFLCNGRQQQLVYHGRIDDRFVDFGVTRPQPTSHDVREATLAALRGELQFRPPQPAIGCPIP